jgi:hypothetical protein
MGVYALHARMAFIFLSVGALFILRNVKRTLRTAAPFVNLDTPPLMVSVIPPIPTVKYSLQTAVIFASLGIS